MRVKEDILLTDKCYKNICMKSNTKKGIEIREKFINLLKD